MERLPTPDGTLAPAKGRFPSKPDPMSLTAYGRGAWPDGSFAYHALIGFNASFAQYVEMYFLSAGPCLDLRV